MSEPVIEWYRRREAERYFKNLKTYSTHTRRGLISTVVLSVSEGLKALHNWTTGAQDAKSETAIAKQEESK